jgi:hypothetical protein
MTAMLDRKWSEVKSSSNLPLRADLHCPFAGCNVSYALSYTDDEFRVIGKETNEDRMRRMALDQIKKDHPAHLTVTFLWKAVGQGPECRWSEADSLAARKAL